MKTVKIAKLVEQTNTFNMSSSDDLKREREARNIWMESILLDAGVYKGFDYLSERQIKGDAISVGIHDYAETIEDKFIDTDHTRIKYYISE